MLRSRIVFLLLISFLLANSCSPVRGLKKAKTDSVNEILPDITVLGHEFTTHLFKANLTVFGNNHSGLFLIKKDIIEVAYHIVFMSEFGLSFLDMTYKNGIITVNNCQKFLDRKPILSGLKNSFELLFIDFPDTSKIKVYKDDQNTIKVFNFRRKSYSYYYFCNQNNFATKIVKNNKFNRTQIEVHSEINTGNFPKSIKIDNKKNRLKIELDLIKTNKE